MLSRVQTECREHEIAFSPTEQIRVEGSWTRPQHRLLEVLEHQEDKSASIAKICQAAAYSGNTVWYQALKDACFVAVVQAQRVFLVMPALR